MGGLAKGLQGGGGATESDRRLDLLSCTEHMHEFPVRPDNFRKFPAALTESRTRHHASLL
jgi:hypothetical protein